MKKTFSLSLLLLSGMSTLNSMDNKKSLDLLAATQSGEICVSQFDQVTKLQPEASRDITQKLRLYVLSDPTTRSRSLPFALLPQFCFPCFNPNGTQATIDGCTNIQNFVQSLGLTLDQKSVKAFLDAFKKSQEPQSKL